MVTIREIKPVRSMCCIILDSGEQYWICQEDLAGNCFREGTSLDSETFLKRIRLLQYPRALNHAISMLARRPCSKKEIFSRLIRLRYTEEVAGLVIYKLEKENLLNDEEFCEQWIRFRLSGRRGPSAIRRELKTKGIQDEIISSSLERIDPDEEQNNVLVLARKAWKRNVSVEDIRKQRQKVILFLVRKGYDWDTARYASDIAEHEKK